MGHATVVDDRHGGAQRDVQGERNRRHPASRQWGMSLTAHRYRRAPVRVVPPGNEKTRRGARWRCQWSIANRRGSHRTHPEVRGTSSALLRPNSPLLSPPSVRPATSASDSASIHHHPIRIVPRQGMPCQHAPTIHRRCVQLAGRNAADSPSALPTAHTDVGRTPARAVRRGTCRGRARERPLRAPTRWTTRSVRGGCRAIMQTRPVQIAAIPHFVARHTPRHRNQPARYRRRVARL